MRNHARVHRFARMAAVLMLMLVLPAGVVAQRTQKPILHGNHWVAITGKPLAATAGAMIFQQGGNAVDAACAMLGATATMWDTFGWGGETQALIFDPNREKVIGINALGVAPTGATPDFFKQRGYEFPPSTGPLAAVTPGNPGGLLVMLAEFGTMSLEQVLAPSIEMADGYAIEAQSANGMEGDREILSQWSYSRDVFLPHLNNHSSDRAAPYPGEVFRQPDLAVTLRKLVTAEKEALLGGSSRKDAIYAAYDRFYKGDIAEEFIRGSRELGGLHTLEDLANYEVYLEEPVMTNYRGIDVYKLTTWVQGPVLLQALNMLEQVDLVNMGFNTARYIHTIYQVMNHAYADRDFYYGDPYYPPEEPIEGLLSKEYAKHRLAQIDWEHNAADVRPGDPYPFQGGTNPFLNYLESWGNDDEGELDPETATADQIASFEGAFYAGTTSVQAADAEGWVVSITPSGGWLPAVIAGHTGIGMSQRMQSFVLDPSQNPYNVVEPGKRPRATLTPSIALKNGEPFLSFAVQGGDGQDQNLLQFFLNVVEFGMNVQQAVEAPNFNSNQMFSSFGDHEKSPGRLLLNDSMPPWARAQLRKMGYSLSFSPRTSGPINAVFFDRKTGTMWGGSSNHGEDYGIAW